MLRGRAEIGVQSDRELVDAINGGDPNAFETLYRRYRDWVYRLAWRFTGDEHDALDVLQETFIYLLRKFPGFELGAAMTTFLYPVVKHLALNVCRRRASVPSPLPREDAQPACDPTPASRADLAAAMATLSPEQREVVLMRFVDDMPLGEIAVALEIRLNTVKSRLYNALQKLRDDPRTRDYFLG
jgi:RNA polymerase sigma-70 factor (ECF subfamily)